MTPRSTTIVQKLIPNSERKILHKFPKSVNGADLELQTLVDYFINFSSLEIPINVKPVELES